MTNYRDPIERFFWQSLRWLAAVLAGGALIWAAYADFGRENTRGYLWLILAGGLGAIFLPRPVFMQWGKTPLRLEFSQGAARQWGAILFTLGLGFLAVATRLFDQRILPNELDRWEDFTTPRVGKMPWDFYGIGLLLTFSGLWLLFPRTVTPPRLPLHGSFWVIVGLSVFLRVYELDHKPLGTWFDEADNAIGAQTILENPAYRPVFYPRTNTSGQHLLLYSLALRLFGETSMEGMRLVSTAFGVGGVALAYAVGSELRGRWFGTLMALFLMTATWSLNFSRLAMTGIDGVFFWLLASLWLIRLAKYGGLRDALYLGTSLGVSLWFYQAMRPQLALFLLALLGIMVGWRTWRGGIIVSVIVVGLIFICVLPALMFERHNPNLLLARTREVSISHPDNRWGMSLTEAYWSNLQGYAHSFHLRGDPNGRHGFPDKPALDPLTGGLFAIGLVLSLRYWRQTEVWLFGLTLLLAQLTAAATLTDETPNTLRTIISLVAVSYFAAWTVWGVGEWFQQAWGQTPFAPAHRPLLGVGLLLLAGGLLAENAGLFFGDWHRESNVYLKYSFVPSMAGEIMATYPPETRLYRVTHLSQSELRFKWRHYTENFYWMSLPDTLPLTIEPAPVVLWLGTKYAYLVEEVRQLYPNAKIMPFIASDYGLYNPPDERELFYMIELSAADIAAVQGLAADGRGVLYAPDYGAYQFQWAAGSQLWVDGQRVGRRETLLLAMGTHDIYLAGGGSLLWKSDRFPLQWARVAPQYLAHAPVENRGLLATIYGNAAWQGNGGFLRIYPMIWADLPMTNWVPYSIEWRGRILIPETGEYKFILQTDEYAALWLDDEWRFRAKDGWGENTFYLEAGDYPIKIRFRDRREVSSISFFWVPPQHDQPEPVPAEVLRPY